MGQSVDEQAISQLARGVVQIRFHDASEGAGGCTIPAYNWFFAPGQSPSTQSQDAH